ncbi:MAG: 16S rRNA (guanine(527)-N(7))-methyltransferase RsmG [Kofleriaceae bacterium]|jgi:16S rRNA (guanine527-N7)-methyltransferase|nr:16S rRNA (guanine(527)-N(7))-methyltransferase RsmG [Kofleriaceae bacterium]MBP9166581.1 16S rRNA (guanine(527)-N(7))-methyltransferase RsmG [Kofleriaceae bacterium]MBP9859673.1 16S rRNA (guanine(527)-N(7))-methyltransferase RsmG [Kofleriaceae bacterium]
MSWRDDLATATRGFDVAGAASALERFVELFETWNRRINLSAARTADEITQHVIDSLAVVRFLGDARRVIDVGSGGGFPGVVAATCLPGKSFVLVEPVRKKTAFLSTAARELGLRGVTIEARRVDPTIDRDFDVAMSRATFALEEWLSLGQRLVRPGGLVLGMEGREKLTLGLRDTRHPYPLGDRDRAIIVRAG